MRRLYLHALIGDSQRVSVLYAIIRDGSGEDRRASVQNRRGRRSGLVCGGPYAARAEQRHRLAVKLIYVPQVQGDNSSDRDLNAVQRGDAEMEQKMNRALRACLERSGGNPICSIHDQGAGGNGGTGFFFFSTII